MGGDVELLADHRVGVWTLLYVYATRPYSSMKGGRESYAGKPPDVLNMAGSVKISVLLVTNYDWEGR